MKSFKNIKKENAYLVILTVFSHSKKIKKGIDELKINDIHKKTYKQISTSQFGF